MAEIKTKPTAIRPSAFIEGVEGEQRRKDCRELITLMKKVTGEPAKMWGPSIIGFGTYHYRYDSGREGDMMLIGFSPRKASLVLYIGGALDDKKRMSKLGKYKNGKGCLYIQTLDDIDRSVLRELVTNSVAEMRRRYPTR